MTEPELDWPEFQDQHAALRRKLMEREIQGLTVRMEYDDSSPSVVMVSAEAVDLDGVVTTIRSRKG